MTNPGGGGAGGFEYGPDSVTAKLSVEVPPQALDNLHQLQKGTADLRAEIEAVSRGMGSWLNYIQSLPEAQERASAAQRTYISLLQQQSYLQQEMGGTHPASTTGGDRNLVPMGYNDPFGGGAGTGGWLRDSGQMAAGPMAFGPQQAQGYMNQLGNQDPRLAVNVQAQRGEQVRADQMDQIYPDRQAQREQVNQTQRNTTMSGQAPGRAAESISNEVAAGRQVSTPRNPPEAPSAGTPGAPGGTSEPGETPPGSSAGGSFMGGLFEGMGMSRGAGALGALGGVAKGLGIAGAAATVGLGANRMIQNAGEQYQEYKNIGLQKGGGAQEGLGMEMQAYQMALNPFITTEQARTIIQGAMREGYTGKEFDTVTGFVAENLKNMNMDIADSFELARSAMVEGGASMEQVTNSLSGLKDAAKDSAMTLEEMTNGIQTVSETGINMGAPGGAALSSAGAFTMAYKDNKVLADLGPQLGQASYSQSMLLRIGQSAGMSGMLPEAIPGAIADSGGNLEDYAGEEIVKLAKQYSGQGRNGIGMFQRMVNAYFGLQLTYPQAEEMMKDALQNGNPMKRGRESNVKSQSKTEQPNIAERIGGAFQATGEGILGTIQGALSWGSGKEDGSRVGLGEAWQNIDHAWNRAGTHQDAASNPLVDQLISQHGAKGIEVIGTDGKTFGLDQNNPEMVERLASGMYKWRPKGSNEAGRTAAEGPSGSGTGRGDFKNDVKVGGELTVKIDQQGRASAPPTVKLTQNQMNAMSGYGRSTMNNPDPGDR